MCMPGRRSLATSTQFVALGLDSIMRNGASGFRPRIMSCVMAVRAGSASSPLCQ